MYKRIWVHIKGEWLYFVASRYDRKRICKKCFSYDDGLPFRREGCDYCARVNKAKQRSIEDRANNLHHALRDPEFAQVVWDERPAHQVVQGNVFGGQAMQELLAAANRIHNRPLPIARFDEGHPPEPNDAPVEPQGMIF